MENPAHFHELSLLIITTVTIQGTYSIVKMIRVKASNGFQSGLFLSLSDREPASSGSTSPNEYAVPKVETTTSLAAKPPTRAIFVR